MMYAALGVGCVGEGRLHPRQDTWSGMGGRPDRDVPGKPREMAFGALIHGKWDPCSRM